MTRRTSILLGLLLTLAAVAAYWPAMGGGYLAWDDHEVIEASRDASVGTILTEPVYQTWLPLYFLSIKLDLAVFGADFPVGLHVENLLLHLLNSLVVFAIARRVLSRVELAWGAAFLFALHPAATESVAWIAERKGLLAFLFSGLSILAFLRAAEAKGLRRFLAHLLGALTLVLALLAKGSALPVPLVLLAYAVLVRWKDRRVGWLLDVAPYFAVAGVLGFVHYRVALDLGPASSGSGPGLVPLVATAFPVLARYLKLLVFPLEGQSLVADVSAVDHLTDSGLIVGVIGVALLAVALVYLAKKDRVGLFALVAAVLALAPYNNILPRTSTLFAERYAYLSVLGAALLIAQLLGRLGKRTVFGLVAVSAVLLVATHLRARVWADGVEVFRDAEAKAGESWLASMKLGDALKMRVGTERGEAVTKTLKEAGGAFRRGLASAETPLEGLRSRIDLSGALLVTGGATDEALEVLAGALPLLEKVPEPARSALALDIHLNRATALSLGGRNPEAVEAYLAAGRAAPRDARPLTGLASAYCRLDRAADGVEAGQAAVDLDPKDEAAAMAFAEALILTGEAGQAKMALTALLEKNDRAPRALVLLGQIALSSARPVEARERFTEALKLVPGNARAEKGLAATELMLAREALSRGDRAEARSFAERSLARDPGNVEAAVTLAAVQANREDAIRLLEAATGLPRGEIAREALSNLHCRAARDSLAGGDDAAAAAATAKALLAAPEELRLPSGSSLTGELVRLRALAAGRDAPGRQNLLVGLAELTAGEYGAAVVRFGDAYREAVNTDQGDDAVQVALLMRGRARTEAGDVDGAAEDLRLLSELEPEDPWVWYSLADSLCRGALAEKSRAIAAGEAFDAEASFEAARAAAARALALAPGHLEILLRKGEIEFAAGRFLDSLKVFSRAKQDFPERVEPMLDLAGLYKTHFLLTEEKQYLSGAIQELREAIAVEPGNARARAALGEALFMGGQARQAVAELSRAVAIDPELTEARRLLAQLYVRNGRSQLDQGGPQGAEDAAKLAQLAIALDEDSPGPHLLLADIARVRKDFQPALEHLSRARNKAPDAPEVRDAGARFHRDLGFAYLLAGRREQAFEQFRKAIDEGSEEVDLDRVKSILEGTEGGGDAEAPIDPRVREILERRLAEAKARFEEAVALLGEEKLDEAVTAILQSLTAQESAEGRLILGRIRMRQGRAEEAERALRSAVEQKPGLYQGWADLGVLLYLENRAEDALPCFQNYLRLAGDSEPTETRARIEAWVKEIREGKKDE